MNFFAVTLFLMGCCVQYTLSLECYDGSIAVTPHTNNAGETTYVKNTCALSTKTCPAGNICESLELTSSNQKTFFYYCAPHPTIPGESVCSCTTPRCNLPAVAVEDCSLTSFESIRSCTDPTTTTATATTVTTTTTTTETATTTTATKPIISTPPISPVTNATTPSGPTAAESNAATTVGGPSLKAYWSLVLLTVMFACGIS